MYDYLLLCLMLSDILFYSIRKFRDNTKPGKNENFDQTESLKNQEEGETADCFTLKELWLIVLCISSSRCHGLFSSV